MKFRIKHLTLLIGSIAAMSLIACDNNGSGVWRVQKLPTSVLDVKASNSNKEAKKVGDKRDVKEVDTASYKTWKESMSDALDACSEHWNEAAELFVRLAYIKRDKTGKLTNVLYPEPLCEKFEGDARKVAGIDETKCAEIDGDALKAEAMVEKAEAAFRRREALKRVMMARAAASSYGNGGLGVSRYGYAPVHIVGGSTFFPGGNAVTAGRNTVLAMGQQRRMNLVLAEAPWMGGRMAFDICDTTFFSNYLAALGGYLIERANKIKDNDPDLAEYYYNRAREYFSAVAYISPEVYGQAVELFMNNQRKYVVPYAKGSVERNSDGVDTGSAGGVETAENTGNIFKNIFSELGKTARNMGIGLANAGKAAAVATVNGLAARAGTQAMMYMAQLSGFGRAYMDTLQFQAAGAMGLYSMPRWTPNGIVMTPNGSRFSPFRVVDPSLTARPPYYSRKGFTF